MHYDEARMAACAWVDNETGLLLVQGGPGSGKTRLMEEVARHTERQTTTARMVTFGDPREWMRLSRMEVMLVDDADAFRDRALRALVWSIAVRASMAGSRTILFVRTDPGAYLPIPYASRKRCITLDTCRDGSHVVY